MIYLSSFGFEMVEFEGVVAGQVFLVSDVETAGVEGVRWAYGGRRNGAHREVAESIVVCAFDRLAIGRFRCASPPESQHIKIRMADSTRSAGL
jgi:hypothetical protein